MSLLVLRPTLTNNEPLLTTKVLVEDDGDTHHPLWATPPGLSTPTTAAKKKQISN
jgi:hypothetical protein